MLAFNAKKKMTESFPINLNLFAGSNPHVLVGVTV